MSLLVRTTTISLPSETRRDGVIVEVVVPRVLMESTLEDMSLNVLGVEIVGIGTLSFVAEKGAEGIDDVWSLVVSRVISAGDFVSPATPGNRDN